MKLSRGYTLIEVLIALSVFAVLATITASTLYYSFTLRSRVLAQAEQLSTLEIAISSMQQDFTQIVERTIRGQDMRLFPAFVAQKKYLEFTRDGASNPKAIEQRSSLKRVALLCTQDQLLRRTWLRLDTPDREHFEERVVLDHLSECSFSYLNKNLQSLDQWREQAVAQDQQREAFPKAVQVHLNLKDWGAMNLLFLIPEALYAKH